MRLVMIRHGQSRHAVEGTADGLHGCRGLTDQGRHEVALLARRLADDHLDGATLISSPVRRAVETAELLGPAVGAQTPIEDCDLCEMHLGEGDGLSRAAFSERYGRFDPVGQPHHAISPGGDSWAGFQQRVTATLERLTGGAGGAPAHEVDLGAGGDVLVVTHAGFLVAVFLHLLAVPAGAPRAWLAPDFASITEWRREEPSGRWTLVRYNDTAHLTGGGGSPPRGSTSASDRQSR